MNTMTIGNHVLPLREVATPDGVMMVPRHVYRRSNRPAWHIEISRQGEPQLRKYFSDNDYCGGAIGSLSGAIETLYAELPNYKTFEQLNPGSSHWYGIRERLNKSGRVTCQVVQTYICGYRNKLRTVQFYVGTTNTRSDKKLRLAIDRAIGTRCWSIDTIRSEGRAVLYTLPVPVNVERFAC
ncbi:hypothetical protein [Bacterioplanoides sp.]|uniref:hypothetical protein n=1 Tax=Bacterioplanoides sp. TaxID=2066072 RepID=UPI003B5C127D